MRQWHSGDCASLTRRYYHRFESCLAHQFMKQLETGPERERIVNMLKDIVKEIDYDIYRGLFVNPEEPEYAEQKIEELMTIIQSHTR